MRYRDGTGVTVDICEAVKWFTRGAEGGDKFAKEALDAANIALVMMPDKSRQLSLSGTQEALKEAAQAVAWPADETAALEASKKAEVIEGV